MKDDTKSPESQASAENNEPSPPDSSNLEIPSEEGRRHQPSWFLVISIGTVTLIMMVALVWLWISFSNELSSKDVQLEKKGRQQLEMMKGMGLVLGKLIAIGWQDQLLTTDYTWVANMLPNIVKTSGVLFVHILNSEHMVVATTDEKFGGEKLATFIPEAILNKDPMLIKMPDRRGYELIVPIFSVTRHLGTIRMGLDDTVLMKE